MAKDDRTLRLRARLDELLKDHVGQCHQSFKHFHSKEFFDSVESTVKDDMGVHLPNHLDFTIAYQFITNLLQEINFYCEDLLEKVQTLCFQTSEKLLKNHFSRFEPVLDLVLNKAEDEFENIKS